VKNLASLAAFNTIKLWRFSSGLLFWPPCTWYGYSSYDPTVLTIQHIYNSVLWIVSVALYQAC